MQVVAAVVDRQHLRRMLRIAQRPLEIDDRVEGVALADPRLTAWRTASRAGFQAPGRKVSFSNGVSVPPKTLIPRAWPRRASCCKPAIICAAVTSSSGFARRLRRSLVPQHDDRRG